MIADAFTEAVNGVLDRRLRNRAQRHTVATVIMAGFSKVRKKPVPNEAERLKKLEERVLKMAENVSLGFVNGRLVVNVVASSESLMNELRLGTDWYDPWSKVDEILLGAILVDPEK